MSRRVVVCRDCGIRIASAATRCVPCENERKREQGRQQRPPCICEWCGVSFDRKRRQRDARRFCSKRCSGARRRNAATFRIRKYVARLQAILRRQLRQFHCPYCGIVVTGTRAVHERVRPECARAARRAAYVDRYEPRGHVRRRCVWCLEWFTSYQTNSRVCEKRECKNRYARARKRHGYTGETPIAVIQARRQLNDAIVAVSSNGGNRGGDNWRLS